MFSIHTYTNLVNYLNFSILSSVWKSAEKKFPTLSISV